MAAPAPPVKMKNGYVPQVLDDAHQARQAGGGFSAFYIQFGSQENRDYCVSRDIWKSFTKRVRR